MKKKTWYLVLFITALIFFVFYLVGLFPITIDSTSEINLNTKCKIGDFIKPLERFDLSKGDCEMFISYSFDDNYSKDKLLNGKVFKCSDKKTLLNFQKDFEFVYTGSDMTTADSKFYIYKDDKLLFVSGIVLDKNCIGFQSMNYGWISNDKLKKYFDNFEKGYSPVIFFK